MLRPQRAGFVWVFLSRAELEAPKGVVVYDLADVRDIPLPTDDRGSILPYLRRFALNR